MNGKEKCKLLREIRKEIAKANDIIYLTADCTYEGDCKGTCPKCDAEIKYLENELNEKTARGEKISLSGLSLDTYLHSFECDNRKENDDFPLGTKGFFYDEDTLDDEVELIVDGEFDEPVMGGLELECIHPKTELLKIEKLNLSTNTYNCLKKSNIHTVEELTNMSDLELIQIKNMNREILVEIKRKIHDLGLLFKDDYE